jgi:hypothetical protein
MELLPLIVDERGEPVGWRVLSDYVTDIVIPPGRSYHIGPFKYPGWIRGLVGISNSPYVQVVHNVFEKEMVFTAYTLLGLGEISPTPIGSVWLQTWDAVNNVYKVLYAPIPPQEFKKGTDIWMTAPTVDPVTGLPITTPAAGTLGWHVILLLDREKFLSKLHEVLREVAARV